MIGIWIPADLGTYINGATMGEFDLAHIEQLLGGEAQAYYLPNVKTFYKNYAEVCFARKDGMALDLPMNFRASTYVSSRSSTLAERDWIAGRALLLGYNFSRGEYVNVYEAREKVSAWKKRDRSLVETLTTT